MRNDMSIDEQIRFLFNRLREWKKLPKYQLERRADIFISMFLTEALSDKYGGTWCLVAPEFPLLQRYLPGWDENRTKIVDERKPALSTNADYLVSNGSSLFLLELKTEKNGINEDQIAKYEKVVGAPFRELVEDIKLIQSRTNEKGKYSYLLSICDKEELKALNVENVIYVTPDLNQWDTRKIFNFYSLSFTDLIKSLENYKNKTSLIEEMINSLKEWNK